jgi:hypothetical protein
MKIEICEHKMSLGAKAVEDAAVLIGAALAAKGSVRMTTR